MLAVKIGTGVETFVGCQDDVGKETDLLQSVRGAIRAGMHGLIRAGDGNRTDLFVGGGQRALME